jgi:hypothetical protein
VHDKNKSQIQGAIPGIIQLHTSSSLMKKKTLLFSAEAKKNKNYTSMEYTFVVYS